MSIDQRLAAAFDELQEIADAALTDFVYAHGSDFDRAEWPGMAALWEWFHGPARQAACGHVWESIRETTGTPIDPDIVRCRICSKVERGKFRVLALPDR